MHSCHCPHILYHHSNNQMYTTMITSMNDWIENWQPKQLSLRCSTIFIFLFQNFMYLSLLLFFLFFYFYFYYCFCSVIFFFALWNNSKSTECKQRKFHLLWMSICKVLIWKIFRNKLKIIIISKVKWYKNGMTKMREKENDGGEKR